MLLFLLNTGVTLLYDLAFMIEFPQARSFINFLSFPLFQKLYDLHSPYCLLTINEVRAQPVDKGLTMFY
jgi:hypothetical protein